MHMPNVTQFRLYDSLNVSYFFGKNWIHLPFKDNNIMQVILTGDHWGKKIPTSNSPDILAAHFANIIHWDKNEVVASFH